MSNSLTVFLAFLGFLLFGYISILRLLVKREFKSLSAAALIESIKDSRVLTSLGSSAFFVSMPATSLLLFWGWGPALLWLIIFHLLVESVFHLQYTTTEQDLSLAELLIRTDKSAFSILENILVQSFFILLMATVITLLATLIDKQSGLLFALIALFPAQQLLRGRNTNIPFALNIISSVLVLALGVVFAHQLGFSVYGDWAPLQGLFGNSLNWLRINNVTLIAALLIITSFLLAKKGQFQTDIATFSGAFIVLLIIIMQVRLALLRPELAAPLNAAQTAANDLPVFLSFCLFIFAGLGALLIRLLNDETNYADAKTSAICFGRLQIESVIQLVFLMLLVLSLAAALGIGAWKTHYTEWDNNGSFIDHLNLAITGTLQLVNSSLKIGTFAHTAIMVGMGIAGVSFSMMCVSRFKISSHKEEGKTSLYSTVMAAKIPQAFIIFILSCYFIANGITITVWLIAGMLSWALIVHLMLAITHEMDEDSNSRLTYGGVCLGLIALGVIQILWLSVAWLIEGNYVPAAISLVIFCSGLVLWWRATMTIAKRFGGNNNSNRLDIN